MENEIKTNNNENLDSTKSKINRVILGLAISFGFCILLLGYVVWVQSETNREMDKKILKYERLYSNELYTKDSALRVIQRLSRYRMIGEAMIYRDSVRSYQKYKVGDVVYKKLDSAKVIISDMVIGGDKHTHYFKYVIITKDNKTEELSPDLIY